MPIVGIEVEYPGMNPDDKRFVHRGRDTSGLQNDLPRHPSGIEAECVYDGTVGAEFVSPRLDSVDAPGWYQEVIDWVENTQGVGYQPTGLMRGGSTAGMHIHISPLSEDEARGLYEISQTSWAKVLFCSAIAMDGDGATWPVFRGGRHCSMNYCGDRYSVVNQRGGSHYEWRLPEPVSPDHFRIVIEFIERFCEQGRQEATEYAQEILNEGDDRITAVKRAEAVGMDIDEIPDIRREPAPEDPLGFFETVNLAWDLPEVHRVDFRGESFYVFESDINDTFEVEGIRFSTDEVLRAGELEEVADEQLRDDVQRAFERRGMSPRRETEATEELKEIIKKKKGKI